MQQDQESHGDIGDTEHVSNGLLAGELNAKEVSVNYRGRDFIFDASSLADASGQEDISGDDLMNGYEYTISVERTIKKKHKNVLLRPFIKSSQTVTENEQRSDRCIWLNLGDYNLLRKLMNRGLPKNLLFLDT